MKKFLAAFIILSASHAFAGLPQELQPEGESANPYAPRIHAMQTAHSLHVVMADGKCARTMTQLQVLFDDVRQMGVHNSRLLLDQTQVAMGDASQVDGYDASVFRGYHTTMQAMTLEGRNRLKETVYSVECDQDTDLMQSIIFASNMVREFKMKQSGK